MKKVSQQAAWQTKQTENGNCRQCGKTSDAGLLCQSCRDKVNARDRRRTGCAKWKKGGMGRPPISSKILVDNNKVVGA